MIQKGFTIVELIVIIVVIGILATIGLVSYNGIQNNAHDTSVQTDLENAASQLEAYRTHQSNVNQEFPSDTTELTAVNIAADKDSYDRNLAVNFVYCTDSTYQQFALAGASKSGNVYVMTEDGFRSTTLTTSSFTASLCGTLGLTLVSNGYDGGAWQGWVKD